MPGGWVLAPILPPQHKVSRGGRAHCIEDVGVVGNQELWPGVDVMVKGPHHLILPPRKELSDLLPCPLAQPPWVPSAILSLRTWTTSCSKPTQPQVSPTMDLGNLPLSLSRLDSLLDKLGSPIPNNFPLTHPSPAPANSQPSSCRPHRELGHLLTSYVQPLSSVALTLDS